MDMARTAQEREEEILEAVFAAAECGEHSLHSIRERCDIELTEEDLQSLETQGMIVRTGDTAALSREGLELAAQVIRRHRLAGVLLTTMLTLRKAHVDELACSLEHTLLPEVEEAICTLLGHPAVCPDGNPIPPGRCCLRGQRDVGRVVKRLSELRSGESGRVSYVRPSDGSHVHRLVSFGLCPGVMVTVRCTMPAFCVAFENTELAIDDEIAGSIYVVQAQDAAAGERGRGVAAEAGSRPRGNGTILARSAPKVDAVEGSMAGRRAARPGVTR
jgi:DtxR family Mn-dependent transcriptional regulator